MKRTNPKGSADPGWVRISWDEAIKIIAENLNKVKAKYGADRVLFYCGDPKEPRPPVMRLARYFGSPNYGCESSVACNLAYVHALELSYGAEISGGPSSKTGCCLIMGKNGSWSAPHKFFNNLLRQKALGLKLIVVDPRRTKVAEQADIHLQLRPGTDGALALGMAKIIIEKRKNGEFFNFFHFMIDLDQGPCAIKRLRGCGCGNEYVSVTPEGDVYPCHQFVGKPEWIMGSVHDQSLNTEIKDSFAKTTVYTKPECKNCWAKFYCSGGCNANNLEYAGSIKKPYKVACELEKKRLECAIMIKAALAD